MGPRALSNSGKIPAQLGKYGEASSKKSTISLNLDSQNCKKVANFT